MTLEQDFDTVRASLALPDVIDALDRIHTALVDHQRFLRESKAEVGRLTHDLHEARLNPMQDDVAEVARLRRIEELARAYVDEPGAAGQGMLLVDLRAALAKEGAAVLTQPDPPLWQQVVVRSQGMCGALVIGADGRLAVCVLSPDHDPSHALEKEEA
jgi:hypothetical protein